MLRLKEIRTENKKTQEAIASVLGISRAAYTNIENGKRDPDTTTLIILADYFKVTVDYLIGREPQHQIPTLLHDELRLVYAYRQADPLYRTVALEMLETHPANASMVNRA